MTSPPTRRLLLAALVLAMLLVACEGGEDVPATPTPEPDTATASAARECDTREVTRRVVTATVHVETQDGYGSAFHIGNGKYVTSAHVVGLGGPMLLRAYDGTLSAATAVEVATSLDAALIHSDLVVDEALEWSGSLVAFGAPVMAAGYPGVEEIIGARTASVSRGTVQGASYVDGVAVVITNTPVDYGSSGGPLTDLCGYVIGVMTALAEDEPLAFAIASDEIVHGLTESRAVSVTPEPALTPEPAPTIEPAVFDPVPSEGEPTKARLRAWLERLDEATTELDAYLADDYLDPSERARIEGWRSVLWQDVQNAEGAAFGEDVFTPACEYARVSAVDGLKDALALADWLHVERPPGAVPPDPLGGQVLVNYARQASDDGWYWHASCGTWQ